MAQHRPIIGITAQHLPFESESFGKSKTWGILEAYTNQIILAGGNPMILVPQPEDASRKFLRIIDGLVLPGGGDIDPALYGQTMAGTRQETIDPYRDAWELAIAAIARRQKIPTLGICRGIQIMNIETGGTLHQHLPDHGTDTVDTAYGTQWNITIKKESRLNTIFEVEKMNVNSLHHQNVDQLGEGFEATAWGDDNTIEAIEPTNPYWPAIGVQWHPECLAEKGQPLFVALTKAAKNHHIKTHATSTTNRPPKR